MSIFGDKKAKEESQELSNEELKARIKTLEAKVAAGEEAALDRVCKVAGVDPGTVRESEKQSGQEDIIECFVPQEVNINGKIYRGKVRVARPVFDMIQMAQGNRRMRYMRELTGNTTILEAIAGGGFAPRVVKSVNEHGEEVSNG